MIVWVTGAGSGIGKAIASHFAAGGATVVASGRHADILDTFATEARDKGWNVLAVPCDVTDADSVRAAHARMVDASGPVDVLVNNAGTTVFTPFVKSALADFDRLVATNLRGPFVCTQAVLPSMLERRSGTVVMVNSMAATHVFPDSSVYSATKAGLKAMTDCLRFEVRKTGCASFQACIPASHQHRELILGGRPIGSARNTPTR
ncbi:MAG: SDR family oxidoreductase [Ignavibacteria bacterium]|nr:SDR family oxidoreductase [Ignavibacteria bacterium]